MKRLQGVWLIAAIVIILSLGEIAPRSVIHSNVEEFAGVEGPAMQCAGLAYMNARNMVSGGPEALVWTALRVIDVKHISQDSSTSERCECPYEVKVRVYTLFGIPYDTVIARCSSAYRLHKPWTVQRPLRKIWWKLRIGRTSDKGREERVVLA